MKHKRIFRKKISRREFLKDAAIGTSGLLVGAKAFAERLDRFVDAQQSTVVICRDVAATSGVNINQSIVQIMVDESLRELTGISDVGEAWKSLFPGITQNSVIGMKINALYGPFSTHPEVINAVVNGLTQMPVNGNNFIRNNIIVWDREDNDLVDAGYTIYTGSDPDRVQYFGTDHAGVGYESFTWDIYGIPKNPTKILGMCDYLVDMALLKAHNLGSSDAGVSHSLKNYYGAVYPYPGDLHANWCDPYIADLNAENGIRVKQKFNIVDGLFGTYNSGPYSGPQIFQIYPEQTPNAILMSIDPVALDYEGKEQIIEAERASRGLPPIYAPHIHTAGQPPYNLGTDDPAEIDLRWIFNPSAIKEGGTLPQTFQLLSITPNPARNKVKIAYSIPERTQVTISFYNVVGVRIARFLPTAQNHGRHVIWWNTRDNRGRRVPQGTYICRIETKTGKIEKKLVVLR